MHRVRGFKGGIMKKLFYVLVVIVLLPVSLPVSSTPALSKAEVNMLLDQATSLHQQAVKNQGGWTITSKFIKKAKKLLADGDSKKALTAASKAREYAELSHQQALSQKKDWSEPPYLK